MIYTDVANLYNNTLECCKIRRAKDKHRNTDDRQEIDIIETRIRRKVNDQDLIISAECCFFLVE